MRRILAAVSLAPCVRAVCAAAARSTRSGRQSGKQPGVAARGHSLVDAAALFGERTPLLFELSGALWESAVPSKVPLKLCPAAACD